MGHSDVVKVLITIGKANVNARDADLETPLRKALSRNHLEVVKLLVNLGKAEVPPEIADKVQKILTD